MNQRPPLTSVAKAAERLFSMITPVGPETVALTDAAGRVLYRDVIAARTQPPFNASAMDGYAVRRAEAAPGARLRVVAEVAAGDAPPSPLRPGEAMRIFTGAAVPDGADAIALQEDVDAIEADGAGWAEIRAPLETQSYIRSAGGDFAEGRVLLTAPRIVSAEDIALAAAAGRPWLDVARRPHVALLSIGDELRMPGEPLEPGAIVASNALGVSALLRSAGAETQILPILADDRAALATAIEQAAGADLIITLGGASDGVHDHARGAFQDAGAMLDFYKIAMRPGKPLAAGKLGAALVLGLPGNPVSAMVCARLFAAPVIAAMQGLPAALPHRREVTLAAALAPNGPREHYMRARLVASALGLQALPVDDQDSSLLSRLAAADILIVRAPHEDERAAGDRVDCILMRTEARFEDQSGLDTKLEHP